MKTTRWVILLLPLCLVASTVQAQNHWNVRQLASVGCSSYDVVRWDTVACIAGGDSFNVYNVADLACPRFVGADHLGWYSFIDRIALDTVGPYVYGVTNGALCSFDCANPAAPSRIGYCWLPSDGGDVAVTGHYAYVAAADSGLRVIDISDPASLVEVGSCQQTGFVNRVAISGQYAYLTSDTILQVVDISDPTGPRLIESYNLGLSMVMGDLLGIWNNYAYVERSGTLQVIDVTDPMSPQSVSALQTGEVVDDIAFFDHFAVIANSSNGIRILDASNPDSLIEVGFYETPGLAWGVTLNGRIAYVADLTYFGIYDCSAAMSASPHTSVLPTKVSLLPAYPNPFNSSTILRLDLPKEIRGRLVAYDLLGREAATLLDGNLTAGSHNVTFNAGALPSGNYFVRLESPEYQAVQKVVLIK
jgi:hypothetical protein